MKSLICFEFRFSDFEFGSGLSELECHKICKFEYKKLSYLGKICINIYNEVLSLKAACPPGWIFWLKDTLLVV
jgi:hypothetical protein